MLLIEVGLEEIIKQPAQDIEILVLLVVGNPAVAQALQDEGDAVHLAVSAGGAAVGPAEAVRADKVGHHLDVLLGVGAEGGQLAIAQGGVGMELQRGTCEDEGHHSIEVELPAVALLDIVKEAGRAGLLDALGEALNQAGGLVLLGEAEAVAADGLGDVKGLPVIVVVAAVEQELVEPLAGFLDETLPDGVALLGGTEREKAERGVGEAVFAGGLGEGLGGDAAGSEVDQVEAFQAGLARCTEIFAEGEGDMAGLIGAGAFAGNGSDGAVGINGVEVVAQHRTGHVETLLGETVHSVGFRVRGWKKGKGRCHGFEKPGQVRS